MAVQIDWGLARTPDFGENALQGFAAGQKLGQQNAVRNALAAADLSSPDGVTTAQNALIRAGDVQGASALATLAATNQKRAAQTAATAYLNKGDYAGAASAVAGASPETAKTYLELDTAQTKRLQDQAKRGSEILAGALSLTPEKRAAYAAEKRDQALKDGISPDQYDKINWADDNELLSRAASNQSLDASLKAYHDAQKSGSEQADKDRTFRLNLDKFNWEKIYQQHQLDISGQNARSSAAGAQTGRDRLDIERTAPGQVVGRILAKRARGEAITPDEQSALTMYGNTVRQPNPLDALLAGSDGGGFGAAPAPAATPPAPLANGPPAAPAAVAPAKAGSSANPFRPKSRAEAAALPSGAFFFDPKGNLIQKH